MAPSAPATPRSDELGIDEDETTKEGGGYNPQESTLAQELPPEAFMDPMAAGEEEREAVGSDGWIYGDPDDDLDFPGTGTDEDMDEMGMDMNEEDEEDPLEEFPLDKEQQMIDFPVDEESSSSRGNSKPLYKKPIAGEFLFFRGFGCPWGWRVLT